MRLRHSGVELKQLFDLWMPLNERKVSNQILTLTIVWRSWFFCRKNVAIISWKLNTSQLRRALTYGTIYIPPTQILNERPTNALQFKQHLASLQSLSKIVLLMKKKNTFFGCEKSVATTKNIVRMRRSRRSREYSNYKMWQYFFLLAIIFIGLLCTIKNKVFISRFFFHLNIHFS